MSPGSTSVPSGAPTGRWSTPTNGSSTVGARPTRSSGPARPAFGWAQAGVAFAITEFLGGLPFIGGGREVWNATSGRPADADSQLLLYRDIGARVSELAPFLALDRDPYFAAADGRLWVMANAYTQTDRYPYAADFGGFNYRHHAVVAVMDAYSGETTLYARDSDPMIATWRKVYPELFTDFSEMPKSLQQHLRYGEGMFDFQARAVERFHVEETEAFFSGNQAWSITEESTGSGVQGQQVLSPARYTFAVLPGTSQERFVAIRAYKPRVRDRAIGFSGWLAVSNEPDDFGSLSLLEFPLNDDPLVAIDTFTSNVGRDQDLSGELGVRGQQALRGNTIVVPVGQGLLYVQPLYLDTRGSSLPKLWRVVVSFGDDEVHVGANFGEALARALAANGDVRVGGPPSETVQQAITRASTAFEAYQRAVGDGDFAAAGAQLAELEEALQRAEQLSGGSSAQGETP